MAYTPRGFPTPVISPAGAGTVTVEKTYEKSDSYGWYNEWAITATAKPGYRFVKFETVEWGGHYRPPKEIHGTWGSPWYPYQDGVVWAGTAEYTEFYYKQVTAVFEAVTPPVTKYAVTTQSSPTAGGSTTGGGSYEAGASVTITATANAGYRFKNWTSGQGETSTDASHTFTMPSYDVTWTAVFVLCTGLILRSATSGVILRSATSGIILRDS